MVKTIILRSFYHPSAPSKTSWWFQPEKYESKWESSPGRGGNEKYLKPSPRKRSFKKDSLKTKNDLKKKNIQPSFNNVLFNNHRIPFPSFSVSSCRRFASLSALCPSTRRFVDPPNRHFFKKLRNRWDGKFEKPPDTVQLMVYCWFGARWFGFLGSPKMKPPGPKPTSNHQLTPVFHQKKRTAPKKILPAQNQTKRPKTVGIFGEPPGPLQPIHFPIH